MLFAPLPPYILRLPLPALEFDPPLSWLYLTELDEEVKLLLFVVEDAVVADDSEAVAAGVDFEVDDDEVEEVLTFVFW